MLILLTKNIRWNEQYTRQSLEELFRLVDDIKSNPKKYKNALDNKIVAVMFFEPSTRTRMSFESAILRVGGRTIATENAMVSSSTRKGETLEDTIKVLNSYADAIVMRHSDVDAAERAASVAKVPILNGGSGKGEHPTQALLDMYTIKEKKGKIDGIKVAILGDLIYGRTIHSLIKLLSLYDNVEIYGLSKEAFKLPEEYINILKDHNIDYKKCTSFDELPRDIDILYHTRIQSERFEGDFGKEEYIINKEVLDKFSEDTLVMHPLPRVDEISTDIDDDPRAVYFEQAENGVYIRMGLLLQVLNKDKIE